MPGVDRLLGDHHQRPGLEDRAVLGHEELRLLGREEVVVAAADELLARVAEQLLARAVEAHEAQVLGVLHEDHVRDVLDDRVEEGQAAPRVLVGRAAGRHVEADGQAAVDPPVGRAPGDVADLPRRRAELHVGGEGLAPEGPPHVLEQRGVIGQRLLDAPAHQALGLAAEHRRHLTEGGEHHPVPVDREQEHGGEREQLSNVALGGGAHARPVAPRSPSVTREPRPSRQVPSPTRAHRAARWRLGRAPRVARALVTRRDA